MAQGLHHAGGTLAAVAVLYGMFMPSADTPTLVYDGDKSVHLRLDDAAISSGTRRQVNITEIVVAGTSAGWLPFWPVLVLLLVAIVLPFLLHPRRTDDSITLQQRVRELEAKLAKSKSGHDELYTKLYKAREAEIQLFHEHRRRVVSEAALKARPRPSRKEELPALPSKTDRLEAENLKLRCELATLRGQLHDERESRQSLGKQFVSVGEELKITKKRARAAETANEHLTGQKIAVEQKLAETKKHARDVETANEQLGGQKAAVEQELAETKEHVRALKTENGQLGGQKFVVEQKLAESRNHASATETANEELTRQKNTVEAALNGANLGLQVTKMALSAKAADVERAMRNSEALELRNSALEREMELLETRLKEAQDGLERASDETTPSSTNTETTLRIQLHDTQQRMFYWYTMAARIHQQAAVNDLKVREDLSRAVNEQKKEVEKKKAEVEKQKLEIAKVREELQESNDLQQSLADHAADLDDEVEGLKQALTAARQGRSS